LYDMETQYLFQSYCQVKLAFLPLTHFRMMIRWAKRT
jgi:hypothetical protein